MDVLSEFKNNSYCCVADPGGASKKYKENKEKKKRCITLFIVLDHLSKRIKDKRVMILGFGREGRSSLKLLYPLFSAKEFIIADGGDITEEDVKNVVSDPDNIRLICGKDYLEHFDECDIILKSPGIVLDEEHLSKVALINDKDDLDDTDDTDSGKPELSSQMQLIYECMRDHIIGITGTKGKSTTTTLTYHVLKEAGFNAYLGGNIGIPVFDLVNDISDKDDKVDRVDIVDRGDIFLVLEMSCHQLEYMNVSPKWAMLLNIYEEHLDHYGSFEKYEKAKRNIYVNQKPGDLLYVGAGFEPGTGLDRSRNIKYNGISKTVVYSEGNPDFDKDKIKLVGLHNYTDIAFVYSLCKDLSISDEVFKRALESYEPLPHRLERFGTYGGITWFDDSISTIDETTINALKTIQNTGSVLIGGMDRGISYVNLEEFLLSSFERNVILMDETGKRILNEISDILVGRGISFEKKETMITFKERGLVIHYTDKMEDAVKLAFKVTKAGESAVLSPAAASYNRFKNFEDRGRRFKELVAGYSVGQPAGQ
ncbi:MAG TPA: UDP-N-acetylmuramoyl-L-alanine--D-glutamate ligase [Lachnospiraceae bacterium]|nr:UDP-N-acetylmuramoyl-L-alanine--D-glutamate ligase [Lachnospiraceae bacterium]